MHVNLVNAEGKNVFYDENDKGIHSKSNIRYNPIILLINSNIIVSNYRQNERYIQTLYCWGYALFARFVANSRLIVVL